MGRHSPISHNQDEINSLSSFGQPDFRKSLLLPSSHLLWTCLPDISILQYAQYSSPVAQYVAPAYATASYARSFNQVQPRLNVVGGQDIIGQTRPLSNSVKATLRQLASDPASVVIVNRIINDKDNICLSSLEEGIAGIEPSTQLVEAAGNDIKALITKVQSFQSLSSPPTVVREVGNILRILGPLINNIAPKNPIICQATSTQA